MLSSDKTNITALTGDRVAHPGLISLGNIHMDVRMKATSYAFLVFILFPCPKFIAPKKIRGALENRIIHMCLDFTLYPLKMVAAHGLMMTDPLGFIRNCFTPLAAYIVDTPEAALLSGVGGKTSHLTMATYKQFGDPFRHEPRTGSTTMAQLHAIRQNVIANQGNPDDIADFLREAKKFRLNGIEKPFWNDWPFSADPDRFLTFEILHHLHKYFFDHELKWCAAIVGEDELDFRFSVFQPKVGYRHFKEGVTKLKQCTGREHRAMESQIVAAIADAAPNEVVLCIRSMIDFRYFGQLPRIDDDIRTRMHECLQTFHRHKDQIIAAGARPSKKGKSNWYIPKLELLQSVVPNIATMGAPLQWTADVTEKMHSTHIKEPARARTNNRDYNPQILRHLDREEKLRQFSLTTSIRKAGIDLRELLVGYESECDEDEEERDSHGNDVENETMGQLALKATHSRPVRQFFAEAAKLVKVPATPKSASRIFSTLSTAFCLTREPNLRKITIDNAATIFNLPDLRPALSDYLSNWANSTQVVSGRRRSASNCKLPFRFINVWFTVRMQTKSPHDSSIILPPRTVKVHPPTDAWPYGRYDTVIYRDNLKSLWPGLGLQGTSLRKYHCVCNLIS